MISPYIYEPGVWPALVTLGLAVYLGQYSWRRRHIAGARPFAIACFFGSFWVLGVILEISATGSSTQIFWHRFQAVWLMPSAVMVTCFILEFAGLQRWLSFRTYALLFLIPLLNALAIATNGLHHLVWTGFEIDGHVVASPGTLFWFLNGYVYLLGLLNLVVLVWLAIRSPRHRLPVAIIIGAQLLARITYTREQIEGNWIGPGESLLASAGVVGVAYAVAFLGFHVIDPVTAASRSVVEQMREGMFVLDLQGRIVDMNAMAAEIVGLPESSLRKRAASEVLPLDLGETADSSGTGALQTEIVLGSGNRQRIYELNRTVLRDRSGDPIGQLLLLHDVTEQSSAQARIVEQQRVVATLKERDRLARELHDGVGQLLGYLAMQAEAALQWVRKGNPEKAEPALKRLAAVAREAHEDVREAILNLKADPAPGWSFLPALEKYLQKFQSLYEIRTELSVSDGVGGETFVPAAGVQLLRVVQEALANSRKHGGARTLNVRIDMEGGRARVTIEDDGRGFDVGRLDDGDGNHFGLIFMRERMEQIGGSLEIDSAPGRGTVLTLGVPTPSHGRSVL